MTTKPKEGKDIKEMINRLATNLDKVARVQLEILKDSIEKDKQIEKMSAEIYRIIESLPHTKECKCKICFDNFKSSKP